MELGYAKGEICNREDCKGLIQEYNIDGGCSCHINPPCGYCTTPKEYCPECNWDAHEEQMEYSRLSDEQYERNKKYYEEQNRAFKQKRNEFYEKFNGRIEPTEFEYRKESHTHFSMKVIGVHPEGFDLSSVMDKIRGTFGGRFVFRDRTRFEYIAYTD